jgi:hypothetical protein
VASALKQQTMKLHFDETSVFSYRTASSASSDSREAVRDG